MSYEKRTTPEEIRELGASQIFVFGSNLGGKHGKGAAKTALSWGAIWGRAAGIQGRTYGIPTKDASIRRVLSVEEIRPFVNDFVAFSKERPDLTFLVTEIGCGLSRYNPKDIAPLFREAMSVKNVHLPRRFWRVLFNRFPEDLKKNLL